MTRLDRRDAYRTEFETWLEEVEPDGDARGAWWRLEASAFYPTSGGQPHDRGELRTMGRRLVVDDVVVRGDTVWHHVRPEEGARDEEGAAAITVGAVVSGRIEWRRRFRHMQRHTGQHLLSQAFVRQGSAFATRAVSLSNADATLDLAGDPDDETIAEAERLANEVAARALAIEAFEIGEDELSRFPLRRPPKVRGRIRVVAMGTWEVSACGGTHLRSTAEAMPVLVLGRARVRGDLVRVTFRTGLEAIAHASATGRAASAAAARLSSGVADLPARVDALVDDVASSRREVAALRAELADEIAAALVERYGRGEHAGVVVHELEPGRAGLERTLADAIAARGATGVVGVRHEDGVRLVLASGAGVDVRPALRAALDAVDGKGGGTAERAQGAGPATASLPDALAAARRLLT